METGTGTVTYKSQDKGYGFIETNKNERCFFHTNEIGCQNFQQLTLKKYVTFEYINSTQGIKVMSILDISNSPKVVNRHNKAINFSEEQIRELFGVLAAEDENIDRFNSYFIKTDTYEKIHNFLPIRILVAHKGIGKSAIFRMSYIENQNNNVLSLWVKPNDIANLGKTEGPIDSLELIRQWQSGLESIIIEKIISNFNLDNENELFKQVTNKGIRLADRISSIVKKIPELINVDTVKKQVAEQYKKNKKIIIFIDDLDRAWDGSTQNISRISALLNAVRDMCSESQELCFRISLRSDVYFLVRTADESTDKIDGNIIWLKWTEHELLALLVKRIQSFFLVEISEKKLLTMNQSEMSSYLDDIMESNFKGAGKWNERPIRYILLSLIRKRPRDLVNLCTLAARNANANSRNLIVTDDWEDIFEQYSLSRLQDTINEHRYELPEIERLLLGMKPSHNAKKEEKPYVYSKKKLFSKVNGIMQNEKFFFSNEKVASTEDLISFMYKINFIVARKDLANGFIDRKYFEDNKYITSSYVDFGYDWEIHPAFRWALYPEAKNVLLGTDFPEFN
ncbi:hypothetical protein GH811_06790 [Acetobacterium malicum]|uniref:CSD domain-containing protein n=1 Tax=Acetobacterium malicum TaxID=52692 RepID=A0ABR6YVV3_9FIRM|nr:cold shock domain-containing protein [Acetobacterium malicum]MBC3899318.1 hypothetical protein [Acetobacterium malicum]